MPALADETIILTAGPAEIQAAADGAKKVPRVSILAYSGSVIVVAGYGSVGFVLAGLDLGEQVTLLADHQEDLGSVVGRGVARVVSGRLEIQGTLSEVTPAGRQVIALAREGQRLQASVGISPTQTRYIREGEVVQLNGRTITAPAGGFRLIEKGVLREVSILPVGADSSTSVDVSARAAINKTKEPHMPQPATDEAVKTAEQIREEAAVESERIGQIRKICANGHAEIEAKAIREGWEPNKAELEVLRTNRPKAPIAFSRSGGVAPTPDILAAATLLHMGKRGLAEKAYGAQVAQQAEDLRVTSTVDLCRAACQAAGITEPRGRLDLIRAAFSTTNLPIAFGSAAEKNLQEAYREAPATWRSFAAVKSAASFRDQTWIRPTFGGNMEQVAPDGEIKHGTLGEETGTFKVETFGKLLRINRTHMVNDDLGILDETATALGRMDARGVNDCVWGVVLSGSAATYTGARKNYQTGAGSALAIAGLGAAVTLMRQQRDADHNDLDLMPAVLAVPPELEVMARRLLDSVEVHPVEGEPTGNALKSIVKLEVEPRLSNADKFAGTSTTAWWLFAGPASAPIIVAFLDGQEMPTAEFFDLNSDPATLGVSWRVYHDYGAAIGDYRAGVYSVGA